MGPSEEPAVQLPELPEPMELLLSEVLPLLGPLGVLGYSP